MISKISLDNFRLFDKREFNTNNSLVILCGNNATGKTSILEAIYLCSTSKSHRTNIASSMIKDGKPFAISRVISDKREYKTVISNEGKKYFIDDKEITRTADYIGNLSVTMSSPLDLELINGSKAIRRRFLDLEISLLDKAYLSHLSKYKQLIAERNNLLKQKSLDKVLLDVLTDQLIDYLDKIYLRRIHFLADLNNYLKDISKSLLIDPVELKYLPTYDSDYKKSFKAKEQLDILTGSTNIGCHRDDFKILMGDKDAYTYASEGQRRLICIAIRLALTVYRYKISGNMPILLLDDVFAALDTTRIASVVKFVKGAKQAFITTTSINDVPGELIRDSLVLNI